MESSVLLGLKLKMEFLSKIICLEIYRYISYINKDRNPLKLDYRPGSGQAVTGLHLSPPTEAGPLTHNTMLNNHSFLLQGSKIIRLIFMIEIVLSSWNLEPL
jgi:hypothetical protein